MTTTVVRAKADMHRGRDESARRAGLPPREEFHRRSRRLKPSQAFIEKWTTPLLLRLTDDAIRAYVTLAKYANQHSGNAYPKDLLFLRHLGFSPYHTDWLSGRTKIWITKKQKCRRESHKRNAINRLRAALRELCENNLLSKGTRLNGYGPYRIYTLLGNSGFPRRMRFDGSTPFFKVPAEIFDRGAFALWKRRFDGIIPLAGTDLRLLLLALRDHDRLRFGGVDPLKLRVQDGALLCPAWPEELQKSETESADSIVNLVSGGYLRSVQVVSSRYDGHVIRYHGDATAPDEQVVTIFTTSPPVHVG